MRSIHFELQLKAYSTTKLVKMLKRRENLIELLDLGVSFLPGFTEDVRNNMLTNATEQKQLIGLELQTRKVYPIGKPEPLSFITGAPKQANAQRG